MNENKVYVCTSNIRCVYVLRAPFTRAGGQDDVSFTNSLRLQNKKHTHTKRERERERD